MNNSDDDEDCRGNWWDEDVYISEVSSDGRLSRRIRRRDRARYLERFLFALIELHMEHVENGVVCIPDGFMIKQRSGAGKPFKRPDVSSLRGSS